MTDDNFQISRRKALAGLATIGAAGAGAGLGTSAYFSDEESFDGNTLTAGELDLYVEYDFSADQDGVEDDNLGTPTDGIIGGGTEEGDGEVSVSYNLADVKPGDTGNLQFCPTIVDNPAWLWVNVGDLVDNENGYTEPEPETSEEEGEGDFNDPGESEGDGELSDSIQLTVSYCDAEGNTLWEMTNPEDYTLAELADEDAFLVDGEVEDGEPGETDPYPGSLESDIQNGPCICIDWEVPSDVGNEIQTDSVEFDVTFYAEQYRHNDDAAAGNAPI